MATLNQFKNEANEALAKAKEILELKGAGPEYDAAWKGYETAKAQYDARRAVEAEEKSLSDEGAPKPSETRNPGDADWIPGQKSVESSKDLADGVVLKGVDGKPEFMPYARPDREGWRKGYPVSAQQASILRRLPEDLLHKKALEEEAFRIYLRHGLAGFRGKEALYAHLKDLQEGTDSEGGYLVPTDERSDIIVDPGATGGVTRGISSVFQTTRDGGSWPTLSTDLTLAAVAEEASFAESDPAFGQVTFTIRKVGRAVDLSYELLADSAVNLPQLLGNRFAAAKGRYEDQQAIEGDGTTEPQGLRVASVSDITDLWTLAAPTALEVVGAFYELPAQFRSNAYWHMTSSAFKWVVSAGSASAGIHLVDLIQNAVEPRVLGRPVVFFDGTGWDDATAITANEEIGAIGDFRQGMYFIDNGNPTVSRSDDVAFRTDQVVFKYRVRYDQRVALTNAFRIIKAAAS
jgi:HK97 family phage major capsid protein